MDTDNTSSTEDKLNMLNQLEFLPDHVYIRNLHLARLLDETSSLDDLKFIMLSQLVQLDRSISALEQNAMTTHNNIKRISEDGSSS